MPSARARRQEGKQWVSGWWRPELREVSMSNIWQIFKRDLQRFFVGTTVVILVVLLVLPSLYAWFSTIAYWDPYGNSGKLPVAIASEDQTVAKPGGGTLNVGDTVLQQIKTNHRLGWRITTAKEAIDGTKSGKYFGAFVIPKDFSADLVGLADLANSQNAKQPKFDFYVNEEINPVAPKILDAGANQLNEQISSTIVSTVSDVVATRLKIGATQLKDEAQTANNTAMQSVLSAAGDLETARAQIDRVRSDALASQKSIATAQKTIADLSNDAATASASLQNSNLMLDRARGSLIAFNTSASSSLSAANATAGAISSRLNTQAGAGARVILTAQGKVDAALEQAQAVNTATATALDDLQSLADSLDSIINSHASTPAESAAAAKLKAQVNAILTQFKQANAKAGATVSALQTGSSDIGATAASIAATANAVNNAVNTLSNESTQLEKTLSATTLPGIQSTLNSVGDANLALQGQLAKVQTAASNANGLLGQLSASMGKLASVLGATSAQMQALHGNLENAATDLGAISSSVAVKQLAKLLQMNPNDISSFMASPSVLKTNTVFPVPTYGSSMAPMFTTLALWIGAFMLVVLIRLEIDRKGLKEKHHPTTIREAYIARLLLITVIGIAQAIVCCAGDLAIGVSVKNVPGFFFAGICESITFCAIVYMLAQCFQVIGRAICIVLIMVQIPGAGGIYPIQMMPKYYQRLYPVMPFTYGINMLRETIGGPYGNAYWHDFMILALFAVGITLIGLGVRKSLINLNLLFDRKLADTDFFIAENGDLPEQHIPLVAAIRALSDHEEYRKREIRYAARFDRAYPRLMTAGFVLATVVAVVPLILMFSTEAKLAMLTTWLVLLVLSFTFIIIVEYLHEGLSRHLQIANMTDADLRKAMNEEREVRSHKPAAPTNVTQRIPRVVPESPADGGLAHDGGNSTTDDSANGKEAQE